MLQVFQGVWEREKTREDDWLKVGLHCLNIAPCYLVCSPLPTFSNRLVSLGALTQYLLNYKLHMFNMCSSRHNKHTRYCRHWGIFGVNRRVCVGFCECTNLSWLPRPMPLSWQCVLSRTVCVLSCACPLVMLRLRRFWLRLSCARSPASRWLLDKPYFSSKQRSGSPLLIGWKIMAPTTLNAQVEEEKRQTTVNNMFYQSNVLS